MLLTIDVGNTNITMGVFAGEVLIGTFRMTTKQARTSDEYGFTICGILEHRNISPKDIHAVIIASVVPDIMHSLTNGIIKYLEVKPLVVSAGINGDSYRNGESEGNRSRPDRGRGGRI